MLRFLFACLLLLDFVYWWFGLVGLGGCVWLCLLCYDSWIRVLGLCGWMNLFGVLVVI